MEKIPCTIAILTFNSAKTLEAALVSVRDFAEIIVCDGGSTDGTLETARKYSARVLPQDARFQDARGRIIDFAGVRNQTLKAAKYDWFFFLDSDELMTPELAAEIHSNILKNVGMLAWWVDRKYMLDGKVIDCAATYPTRQMRFFHKGAVIEFIKPIHERINLRPDATIRQTENFMIVPINPDPKFHREKWNHYIKLEVDRRGKISFTDWLSVCAENLKISALYLFRYGRNLAFCHGVKMPWRLEWERHVYHWNLSKKLISNIFYTKTICRVIVAAMLVSKDGRILQGLKSDPGRDAYNGSWSMPGGGVEKDESLEEALVREVREETGIDLAGIKFTLVSEGYGEGEKLKNGKRQKIKMKFHNYLVNLPWLADDIKAVSEDGEYSEFRWTRPEELKDLKLTPPSAEMLRKLGYL